MNLTISGIIILVFFVILIVILMRRQKYNATIKIGDNIYTKITIPFHIALNGGIKKIYIKDISYNLIIPKGITSGKILRVRRTNEDWFIEVLVVDKDNIIYKIIGGSLMVIFIIVFLKDNYKIYPNFKPQKDLNYILDPNLYEQTNGFFIKTNVSDKDDIKSKALELSQGCFDDDFCKTQKIFEFVRDIPYQKNPNPTPQHPIKTLELNKGDCDDKSNLLVSLFHAVGLKSYLVDLQDQYKHMFVIVETNKFEDNDRFILLNGKKFAICDPAYEGSPVGIPLGNALLGKRLLRSDIELIIEPFEKETIYPNENNIKGNL